MHLKRIGFIGGYVKDLDKCPSVFGRHLIFVMNIPHTKWGRQKSTPSP
jgi:hypothetical protein